MFNYQAYERRCLLRALRALQAGDDIAHMDERFVERARAILCAGTLAQVIMLALLEV